MTQPDRARDAPRRNFDAVIVGAGFARLYMLYRLRGLGMSVRLFERGDDVGGTWYWNRYPGARCDVESMVYSYSFSKELAQEWDWTERFPAQPEILRYLRHVADRFDLRKDIAFGTNVVSAEYDETANHWTVKTEPGDIVTARYAVMATGCLSQGRIPAIKGLDDFGGDWYHTGSWPHDPVDFTGKRVAVIGTGATGIQVIPVVAKQAAHTYVFQRTPSFSVPARNVALDPDFVSDFKARHDEIREDARFGRVFGSGDLGLTAEERQPLAPSGAEASPELRRKAFEQRWQRGGSYFMVTFPDQLTNRDANEAACDFIRSKIREVVENKRVADILSPKGYPVGSKRICLDTGYYQTFNRDDVTLVDALATPIEAITAAGIQTSEAEYDVDIIIFATGFDAFTGSLFNIDIRGRDGLRLRDKWQAGPKAFLGMMTAGFPNLFLITGPGSPSVISNVVVSIEHDVEWISNCLHHMKEQRLTRVEAELDAEDDWVAHVNAVAGATLFPVANSWYVGTNVPGKPRIFIPYVAGVGAFREACKRVADADYEGLRLA